jgi:hypothetical protein
MIVKFLRYLLPLLTPSFVVPTNEKVLTKVSRNLDFYLPFRQHAPSLANARRVIYADVDRLTNDDGVGFFNILAFRGVFFGSPFAKSDQFRWFSSLEDWELFQEGNDEANQFKGEEYYVNKGCYGRSQSGRQLSLLSSYWEQRLQWNDMFNKPEKPTITKIFRWLTSRDTNVKTKVSTLFRNIGPLTALLICGDLVEAGILPMPSAKEWARYINKMGKGSKEGMEICGLVGKNNSEEDFCTAFSLLDQALQIELHDEEKETMGYNIVMLEHALCKIKRIGVDSFRV